MKKLQLALTCKQTVEEIMGLEGICSSIYFEAFSKMLKCDMPFAGRNRRPPKDPVNALLSLAYSFLTKEICSVVDAEGFEGYVGFLHGVRYGRKSRALDIMEEFRQPVADRLVLHLLNKRMLTIDDFVLQNGSVILQDAAFKKFCMEFEAWMNGTSNLPGDECFRIRIRETVVALKKDIMNETPDAREESKCM